MSLFGAIVIGIGAATVGAVVTVKVVSNIQRKKYRKKVFDEANLPSKANDLRQTINPATKKNYTNEEANAEIEKIKARLNLKVEAYDTLEDKILLKAAKAVVKINNWTEKNKGLIENFERLLGAATAIVSLIIPCVALAYSVKQFDTENSMEKSLSDLNKNVSEINHWTNYIYKNTPQLMEEKAKDQAFNNMLDSIAAFEDARKKGLVEVHSF